MPPKAPPRLRSPEYGDAAAEEGREEETPQMTPAEKLASEKGLSQKPSRVHKRVWHCHIREMRAKLGLTLKDVQGATGIHVSTLSVIETGGDPKLKTAVRIAQFFGVSVEEMWPSQIE